MSTKKQRYIAEEISSGEYCIVQFENMFYRAMFVEYNETGSLVFKLHGLIHEKIYKYCTI